MDINVYVKDSKTKGKLTVACGVIFWLVTKLISSEVRIAALEKKVEELKKGTNG
jgi:hypothetical protein